MHSHIFDELLEEILLSKVLWKLSLMSLSPFLDGLDQNYSEWRVIVVVSGLCAFKTCQVDGHAVFKQLRPRARKPEVRLVFHGNLGLDNARLRLVVPQITNHAVLSDEHERYVVRLTELGNLDSNRVVCIVKEDKTGLLDVICMGLQVLCDGHVQVVTLDVGVQL